MQRRREQQVKEAGAHAGVRPGALALASLAALATLVPACTVVRPWAPPALSAVHRAEGRGFFGWAAWGWVLVGPEVFTTCEALTVGLRLASPEGRAVDVECCHGSEPRFAEHRGRRWTVRGRDLTCRLRADDADVGTLVLRRRDDRRLVGRLETDGPPVQVAATDRLAAPGKVAPWELVPTGAASGWELFVDGRLVGVVGTGPQAHLQARPDLTPAQRRAVGLAATVLALLEIDGPGSVR